MFKLKLKSCRVCGRRGANPLRPWPLRRYITIFTQREPQIYIITSSQQSQSSFIDSTSPKFRFKSFRFAITGVRKFASSVFRSHQLSVKNCGSQGPEHTVLPVLFQSVVNQSKLNDFFACGASSLSILCEMYIKLVKRRKKGIKCNIKSPL